MEIVQNQDFRQGIREMVALVASTMGPAGHNVMLTQEDQSFVFRDGAQVVRSYLPKETVKRNAVLRLRDAAEATLRFAGDGTSTTTVFLGSLYEAVESKIDRYAAEGVVVNRKMVVDALRTMLAEMVTFIEENSIKVTHKNGKINKALLEKVATVAANNNAEIGLLVADMVAKLGATANVKLAHSKTDKYEAETAAGYAFNSGLIDPQFLPFGERQVSYENPYIVLVDDTVASFADLKPIADAFNKNSFLNNEGRMLFIVCSDLAGVAKATVISRQHADAQGNPTGRQFALAAIAPPKDVNPKQFYEELAAVTGARVIGKEWGRPVSRFTWDDAGTVNTIVTSLANTTVEYTDHTRPNRDNVTKLTERLKKDMEAAEKEDVQGFKDRINRLNGLIGTIRIPGLTPGAIYMNKEIVDDSFLAAQNALKHGVSPGCARMLHAAAECVSAFWTEESTIESGVALNGIDRAVSAVLGAVIHNAGGNDDLVDQVREWYESVSIATTLSVDSKFMVYAQNYVRGSANVPAPAPSLVQRMFKSTPVGTAKGPDYPLKMANECLVDAVEAGVLDSTGGLIAALENTATEISLWVLTQNIVKHV